MAEASPNQPSERRDQPLFATEVDSLCRKFRTACSAGEEPRIETYLANWSGDPARLLAELLPLELEFRTQAGDSPMLESYLARFSPYAEVVRNVFACLETVDHVADEETARFESSQDVLKSRCPHCHSRVEIQELPTLGEISCPSCHSSFSLASGSSLASNSDGRKFGHFELLEQLGMGAFGTVWKATDTELDRLVAIKIPRRNELDAEEIEKFIREARAAAQLNHPNIVGVHEVGREGETVYIVSDYVSGLSLDQWLAGQQLTPREATELCRKIAIALQHAHDVGVIHRDLKPSNIMIDQAGEPHVMDFGLAKREVGEVTMTMEGQILGTPAYMSPEQASGEGYNADRRSDVYSLGVLLFELLTGQRPFRASNIRMLLESVIHDESPSPRKFDSRVPEDLETITLKCLEKEPAKRYPTASALADELGRYLRGEPIHARKISRTERAWRWCKRNPVVAGLSAAVLLVLCLGILATSLFALDARREAQAKSIALIERNEQAKLASQEAARAKQEETRAIEQAKLAKEQEAIAKEREEFAREQEKIAQEQARVAKEQEANAKQQEAIANRRLYAAQIASAQRAWRDNDILLAGEELRKCAVELRGWEYRYLSKLFTGTRRTLAEHLRTVNSLAFSPDGQQLASGSFERVMLWDLKTDSPSGSLGGYSGFIWSVAYSPDGKRIAVGAAEEEIKIWDVERKEVMHTLTGHTAEVMSVAFDPLGEKIVSGSRDNLIKVWDAATGKELFTLNGHTKGVHTVTFSPDGQWIASGSADATVKIWNVVSREENFTFSGHGEAVWTITYSPDGKRIASGSADRTAKVWDAETGSVIFTTPLHQYAVRGVVFSPDAQQLISLATMIVSIWDIQTGEEINQLKGHVHATWCGAYSPDGKWIATGSADKTVKIWSADPDRRDHLIRAHREAILDLDIDPTGNMLVSTSVDKTVKLWDANTEMKLQDLTGPMGVTLSLEFSPDASRIVGRVTDNTIRIWQKGAVEKPKVLSAPQDPVGYVIFTPDGQEVLSGVYNNDNRHWSIHFWNVSTGEITRALEDHQCYISCLVFSPDGQQLLISYQDGIIKVLEMPAAKELFELIGHRVVAPRAAYSPDGRKIVTGSHDRTIKVWDATTGKVLMTFTGHGGNINHVAFSPQGKRIVSTSVDKTIKLWDTASGEEMLTLKGHGSVPYGAAFTPDGNRLISYHEDGTIRIWIADP